MKFEKIHKNTFCYRKKWYPYINVHLYVRYVKGFGIKPIGLAFRFNNHMLAFLFYNENYKFL